MNRLDPTLEQVPQPGSEDQALRLVRRLDPNELVITPARMNAGDIASSTAFHSFSCDLAVAADGRALPLTVNIHVRLLNDTDPDWRLTTDASKVTDNIAIELATGLFNLDSIPQMSGKTVLYMVRMLCTRLISTQPAAEYSALRFEAWQFKEVARLVRQAASGGITTREIAGRCGLSICQFSRVFKSTYGLSVHRYVLKARIQKAMEMLAATREPIAFIALDCGFSDQSSFTRRFTALTGQSPTAWRRGAEVEASPAMFAARSSFGVPELLTI